jgi:hypothetical protein
MRDEVRIRLFSGFTFVSHVIDVAMLSANYNSADSLKINRIKQARFVFSSLVVLFSLLFIIYPHKWNDDKFIWPFSAIYLISIITIMSQAHAQS